MYGTNGTGSILGAAATIVSTSFGAYILGKSSVVSYVKWIAILSYILLAGVLISFIAKKIAFKRTHHR